MLVVTKRKNIIIEWITWHYGVAVKEIVKKWKNLLLFNLEYFSIILLIKTLFAPWRRYFISYGRGIDISRYVEAFIMNIFSRFVGMIVRIILIVLGIVAQVIIFVVGVVFLIFWIIMPLIIILGLFFSIKWILI